MPATSTPLRYPGGKSQLRPFVRSAINYTGKRIDSYCEPYCGGAGIAIDLLLKGDVSEIVINDADPAIYSFWRSVIHESSRLINDLQNVDVSIREWHRQRGIYRELSDALENDVRYNYELGFAAFYLNRTNVSGIIKGGCIGGQRQRGKIKIDARFNRTTLSEKISSIGARADSIHLFSDDGKTLLTRLNDGLLPVDPSHSFCLIDPPYVKQGRNLYLNSFSYEEHVALRDVVRDLRSFSWVLTYDDCDVISELYAGFGLRHLNVRYSSNVRSLAREILISSEDLKDFEHPRIIDP